MYEPHLRLIYDTWARGYHFPALSPAAALKHHPTEFIELLLEMARIAQADIKFPANSPANQKISPSCSPEPTPSKNKGLPPSDQLELFAPWEV